MLEALIGMVLLGIVGLGMTIVAARTLQNQGQAATQTTVVQQMRYALQSQNLCAGGSLAITPLVPFTSQCTPLAATIAVPAHPELNITFTAQALASAQANLHTIQLQTQATQVQGNAQQRLGSATVSIQP